MMNNIKKSFKDSIPKKTRRIHDAAKTFVCTFDLYEVSGPHQEDDGIIDWGDVIEDLNCLIDEIEK